MEPVFNWFVLENSSNFQRVSCKMVGSKQEVENPQGPLSPEPLIRSQNEIVSMSEQCVDHGSGLKAMIEVDEVAIEIKKVIEYGEQDGEQQAQ